MKSNKIIKGFSGFVSVLTVSAILSTAAFAAGPQKVDLRDEINNRGISVRNQGSRGTCVLQALTFLEEYALTGTYGTSYNHMSIDYGIQAGNRVIGEQQDESSSFNKFYRGYNEFGAITDSSWSYDGNADYNYNSWDAVFSNFIGAGQSLLQDGYRLAGKCLREGGEGPVTDEQIDEVIGYLNRGIPVAQAHAGHATAIVGYERNSSYDGGGYFLYRNSWDTTFEDQGYGKYTFGEMKAANNNVALFVFETASQFPKIYKHGDYQGYNVALAPGKYTLTQLNNIGVENDDISSIVIPSGYTAYLYEDDNFGGTVKTLTSDVNSLASIDFNDKLSSLEIVSELPTVYQDINHDGYAVTLAPGKYTLAQLENLGISNDDLSSIEVPDGYTVYLYQHDNFGGEVKTLIDDEADFRNLSFNDEVSSILVVR
ncbi:beta/gamma crystallin-related protein [Pseudobacteroides cellulosolvens]|uniref:Beta and gamma crystallin n=1 Tax=Pseudobacteroides cellulosolvens ATCC 35603 = DSM 2933 TaxID=398512 RepID=A0A0L6JNX1_9FIRM|nr:beta/gamma crystallin-related protein [Pseudobacteroides cellulosolvens]KNY27067.1 beta and gamma crystallin [Pseudobacteroides cellulosolvens ATCC 35603 = DSM 2933]